MESLVRLKLIFASSALALLAACGGGDSAPTFKLSGVAATGLAYEGATVSVQCASGGVASAITGKDGSYSVNIDGGTPPCLVTITKGSTVLQAITNSNVANVTPLTDSMVKALASAKGVGNSVQSLVTPGSRAIVSSADLSAAQAQVKTALKAATNGEVNIDNVDLVSGVLVAATGTTTGNDYDKALDALKAQGVITVTGTVVPTVQQGVNTQVGTIVKPNATGV